MCTLRARKKHSNIISTPRVDAMLVATFLTTIFYSATYPYIHRAIMQVASSPIIALNQIINCISIVFFGWIWNHRSDSLFHLYPAYCIMETALGVCSTLYAIMTGNIIAYYIIDTVLFAVITRNIICGGIKLKAIRYATEEMREQFDNNNNSAAAVATIIGSLIAISLNLEFPIMLCIATFGNAIDNIFYICIYFAERRKRNERT